MTRMQMWGVATMTENKKLTLLATERRAGRVMELYRCICGKEAWLRANMTRERFRTCDCPPKPYLDTHKTCTKCRESKSVDEFFRDSKTGNPRPICKACHKAQTRSWQTKNPEKHQASATLRNKIAHARNRFGLTAEEYQARVKAHKVCEICGNPEPQKRRQGKLSLDHCHKTKKIRGVLCSRCNTMLGYANDDPEVLRSALRYLAKHT
ncbi:endonuclease domain-containing protein [Burkholderia cenocepacia]|uniref:endonuclease domain-containing protein n=1 Tax=Burkholderia cenocepacia TaxID=95486 RepID=UPI0038F76602